MVPGFAFSCERQLIDLYELYELLRTTHWAKNRSIETIEKSINHSLCFGIYKETQLVAFARVITDQSTFAYLCDVVVFEKYRGLGLSKWLMAEIMAQPSLQHLRRFFLFTKDAHSLYARFGFEALSDEENRRAMEILKEDI